MVYSYARMRNIFKRIPKRTLLKLHRFNYSSGVLYLDSRKWWIGLDKIISKDNSKPMPYADFIKLYRKD